MPKAGRALVFWFTGLSGSGKTSVVERVLPLLERSGIRVLVLDGDRVRETLHPRLSFSPADIIANNEAIAVLCEKERAAYDAIIVPIISPLRASRSAARKRLGEGFYEVYFNADLACVSARDVKGLYAKAARGDIRDMIGLPGGCAYEAPENPDCVIESGNESLEASAEKFRSFVASQMKGRDRV